MLRKEGAQVTVPPDGYVQVYVANESDTDVYFDDIQVEHRQGLQVQETQYDPYGLELAGLNRAPLQENKHTWNEVACLKNNMAVTLYYTSATVQIAQVQLLG